MREQYIDLAVGILGRSPSPAELAGWSGQDLKLIVTLQGVTTLTAAELTDFV